MPILLLEDRKYHQYINTSNVKHRTDEDISDNIKQTDASLVKQCCIVQEIGIEHVFQQHLPQKLK